MFVIWGVALATSKQSPVNLILWGVIATVAWTGATSRIEMRSDALCIVNIATVAYVAAADITRVESRPSVMVVTKDYSYGSTLFSASLSGRASGYVAWDAAADRIQNWLEASSARSHDALPHGEPQLFGALVAPSGFAPSGG